MQDCRGNTLAIGDICRIRWNGFPGVAKWEGYGDLASSVQVKLVRFGRTRWTVESTGSGPRCAGDILKVLPDQLKKEEVK